MTSLHSTAASAPHKIACRIADTGETLNYRDLDIRSNKLAGLFDSMDLQEQDVVGILLDNDLRYLEIVWAARRRGLYYVPISCHLVAAEVEFILRDCGAGLIFVSAAFESTVRAAGTAARVVVLDSGDHASDYEMLRDAQPEAPGDIGRRTGRDLCYSSGTTGRPKGIVHSLFDSREQEKASSGMLSAFGFTPQTVYLSPAPLYHAAPLRFVVGVTVVGGTVVLMKKFDARRALENIQKFRITHSQWVPTMFFRMLALPAQERAAYDLSSHEVAIHSAAPCPPVVKQQMLQWWGDVLWEYYAGSERVGGTVISSQEWKQRPGSVGQARSGVVHILGDDDEELGPHQVGNVYFDGQPFSYLNDPAKTAAAMSRQGWGTFGDVGYVDEEGYLFLTGRQADMVISGGVNIYPAEAENILMTHTDVADVAVFGIPSEEFGEEVKAAVQLKSGVLASPELARQLLDFCRARMSRVKAPRSIDFHAALPRQENGKLRKRVLQQAYAAKTAA